MTRSEYLCKLAEVFELSAAEMSTELVLRDLPRWGSLTLLGVLGMTDEELGIALAPRDVLNCQTVGDLVKLVESKLDAG